MIGSLAKEWAGSVFNTVVRSLSVNRVNIYFILLWI